MIISMKFVTLFLLCSVSGCLSKPTVESDLLATGRGIGSTIWDWLTYPFTWWSSEPELPINYQLILTTTSTIGPQDSIEIAKHNVTVWCNDQTCTTMKCDNFGCRNTTCNIYDTDLMGECREFNIISTPEHHSPQPTEPIPKPIENKATESLATVPISTAAPVTTTVKDIAPVEEHPLGLEAVLSSTVKENGKNESADKAIATNPEQKV